ncbi:AI-2E family transporter [Paeniglutamicibacter sp. NPDC012692]|uniref:AI-2E family transporter n=1 Tax=Paeniglutamicibacter sp. NPDC012692 TaxID=3364388 RepID=UPI003684B807
MNEHRADAVGGMADSQGLGGSLRRRPREIHHSESPSSVPGTTTTPVAKGFKVTIGVLLALLLAASLSALSNVVFSVVAALFLALALNPLIAMLQRRGVSRGKAITLIALVFALIAGAFLALLVPLAIRQTVELVRFLPGGLESLSNQPWVLRLNEVSNGGVDSILKTVGVTISSPAFWSSVAGGALRLGSTIVGSVSSGVFISVLTLYFLVSLRGIKRGFYSLVPASKRHSTIYLTEKITDSVGRYLGGMVVLALCNAAFSLLLLTLLGVPFAGVISLVAFFITLIPLIGTILTTGIMTVFAVIHSPVAGLVVLVAMLIYMQVEAYVMTPKVMSKALEVPGAMVLISATAGATLLGLPGALIAVPVAAAGILIVRNVVVPRRSKQ